MCSDVIFHFHVQEETQLGAKNRAEGAYKKYKEKNGVYPNLAVGLEGGLEWSSSIQDANGEDTLWCMAWMAIYGKRNSLLADCLASSESKFYAADRKPICCLSKTGTFLLPSSLAKYIEDGMELGHADDKVFGRVNSKHKSGTVGVLTDGIIDRTAYYEHALILALVPWIRPDVYTAPAQQTNRQDSVESTTSDSGSASLIGSLFCSSRKV
jgi:non-canonical (house-cleaning) NTP pyrophosphatase